jgi:hypothetical protein
VIRLCCVRHLRSRSRPQRLNTGYLVDWNNLKADYERLGSYSAVAAEYGVSKAYVAQQAKKQGINPKPEGRSLLLDWSDLPGLYASGTCQVK